MGRGNRILKNISYVTVIVALSKILGFVRQLVVANAFGASLHTDLISLSEGLISNVDYLLIQTFATAFVPIYLTAKSDPNKREDEFVSSTLELVLLLTLGIVAVMEIGAPLIARLLAPKYTSEVSARLAQYLRIVAPALILLVLVAFYSALLKSNEAFIHAELVSAYQSVIAIIAVLLLGARLGPDTLLFAFFAAALINSVYLSVMARKLWRWQASKPLQNEEVRSMLRMLLPLLFGYAMVFINQQIDKIIVSGLGDGIVTSMNYAAVLSNFVTTFIGSVCTVFFTYVTQRIVEKREKEAAELVQRMSVALVTLLIPVSMITAINSRDISALVYGRGAFDETAVINTAAALSGYGLMFVPIVLRELFTRMQYGYQDTKAPAWNSTISIGVNIIGSLVLSRFWGVFGVTAATSLSVLVCGILNVITVKRHNAEIRFSKYRKELLLWIFGSVVCGICAAVANRIGMEWTALPRFAFVCCLVFVPYILAEIPIWVPLVKEFQQKRKGGVPS